MRININNMEKLSAAIKEAEGKSRVRTISAEDIQEALHDIEHGIAKKKLHGTIVHYDGAEHFPHAYKYRPESTHWTAENIRGKWYVTDIKRAACPNRSTWNTIIVYSDEAKEAILEAAAHRNC